MFRTHRLSPALLLTAGVLIATPACATGSYYGYGHDPYYRDFERRAYQNGFDRGLRHGERDARDGRSFSYSHDREYRDADDGFYRGAGSREEYRRFFRQGYEAGYTQGYDRVARAYGSRYPNTYPTYPGRDGRYGTAIPRGSRAAQIGYRDGYEAGRDDARDRARYDPIRPKRYREGDHDYDSRYGSRDEYKREYRAAFQQGYDQGYRENRR